MKKTLIITALLLTSFKALADYKYRCPMYPDEQGGNTFFIRIIRDQIKLYSFNESEEGSKPTYFKTLLPLGSQNALIKHYAETRINGYEVFIRRGAASLGRIDPRSQKFRFYTCFNE